MLNKSFNRKFSKEQFSILVFFHKNAYPARYLRKTVFWRVQTPIKKTEGGYCGIFSMFFRTSFYTTFSNQTFACTIYTIFFEISLICLDYKHEKTNTNVLTASERCCKQSPPWWRRSLSIAYSNSRMQLTHWRLFFHWVAVIAISDFSFKFFLFNVV